MFADIQILFPYVSSLFVLLYMKNHQIRARRAEGSAVSAPEYAVNCLNVDIILAKGRSDVRELSVRLYTSAYRLMGVAARQASSSKAIRTWHFEVSSSDAFSLHGRRH